MQHQKRRWHARDALVRMKTVFRHPAHRRERIGGGADIRGGGERRIEDQGADLTLGGECDRNPGTE